MTVRIVDRRFDSKNRSSVNRARFIRRFKGQIHKAVSDAIGQRGVRDLDNGEKIGIAGKDSEEPQFAHGRGGVWDSVNAGNDRFSQGDEVDRPLGGGGGSGRGHGHRGRRLQGHHRGGHGHTGRFDDAHLAFVFGDFQLGDVRLRHQIDQGLELAQVHGDSSGTMDSPDRGRIRASRSTGMNSPVCWRINRQLHATCGIFTGTNDPVPLVLRLRRSPHRPA